MMTHGFRLGIVRREPLIRRSRRKADLQPVSDRDQRFDQLVHHRFRITRAEGNHKRYSFASSAMKCSAVG